MFLNDFFPNKVFILAGYKDTALEKAKQIGSSLVWLTIISYIFNVYGGVHARRSVCLFEQVHSCFNVGFHPNCEAFCHSRF